MNDSKVITPVSKEYEELVRAQAKVKRRISEINTELEKMPKPTADTYGGGLPDLTKPGDKRFKIPDYKKSQKLRRELTQLKAQEEENARKIKILKLDGLIGKIDDLAKDTVNE